MATHSSILVWRIPGTGEPGGLLSLGSYRVGHDWSDLAATAAALLKIIKVISFSFQYCVWNLVCILCFSILDQSGHILSAQEPCACLIGQCRCGPSGRKGLKECIKVFVLFFNVTMNHSEIGKGKNIVRKMCGIPGDFRKRESVNKLY